MTPIGVLRHAFPLGYFVYRKVFGHTNLSLLCTVTLFVVIGIGVDDIFVFTDMFVQPAKDVSLERRMMTRWSPRLAPRSSPP